MFVSFYDGNKDILEASVIIQLYFLPFKIYVHIFCVIFWHMKNLTDSCKTKVKHTSMSCQRRLYGSNEIHHVLYIIRYASEFYIV
jgi:hypothetical protein